MSANYEHHKFKATIAAILISVLVLVGVCAVADASKFDDDVTDAAMKLVDACHALTDALDRADNVAPTTSRRKFIDCASFFDKLAGLPVYDSSS